MSPLDLALIGALCLVIGIGMNLQPHPTPLDLSDGAFLIVIGLLTFGVAGVEAVVV